jgi:hypothetical protein
MEMATSPPASWAAKVSAAVGVLALILGGLWYVANLNARVDRVEAVVANPAAESKNLTCGELAAQVSDAYRSGDGRTVAEPLERLMDRMGCGPSSHSAETGA